MPVIASPALRSSRRMAAVTLCGIAAFGLWEHASPGRLDARCFNVVWGQAT